MPFSLGSGTVGFVRADFQRNTINEYNFMQINLFANKCPFVIMMQNVNAEFLQALS